MILAGLALAFSRVIDNSVISLENIYRHLEMGSTPVVAATMGGAEVNMAVLAATLVDVVDFFPVTLLIRRQQIPVLGAGSVLRAGDAGFLRGRHDRDSAVLRPLSEGRAARRAKGMKRPGRNWLQCRVQSRLQSRAERI